MATGAAVSVARSTESEKLPLLDSQVIKGLKVSPEWFGLFLKGFEKLMEAGQENLENTGLHEHAERPPRVAPLEHLHNLLTGSRNSTFQEVPTLPDHRHNRLPDLKIVARVRDTKHAEEVMKAGAIAAVPDAVASGLHLAQSVLRAFELPTGDLSRMIAEYRAPTA